MNKDVINLANHFTSTLSNIAQMAQYRYLYTLGKELQKDSLVQLNACELAQNRDKMIKYTCLAGLCIAGLFTFGIAGLINKE